MSDPILVPVPKNNSLWRPERGMLVVEVRNNGDDTTRPVKVKVQYNGSWGDPPKFIGQELEMPILKKGKTIELKFELPNKDCFDPDIDEFDFHIIIDEGGPWVCTKNPTGNKQDIL